jgi:hypothetical protein
LLNQQPINGIPTPDKSTNQSDILTGTTKKASSTGTFTYGPNTYTWVDYTVKPGDSLSQIAARTLNDGSSSGYNFIAQHDGITNVNVIQANKQIQVPQLVSSQKPTANAANQNWITTGGGADLGNGGGANNGSSQTSVTLTTTQKSNFPIQGSIGSFYYSHPTIAQDLGQTTGAEFQFPPGTSSGKWRQNFQNGAIFHTANGTFSVHGSLGNYYLNNLGGENSQLGLPTSEESNTGNGNWRQNFENGYLEWLNNGTAKVTLTTTQTMSNNVASIPTNPFAQLPSGQLTSLDSQEVARLNQIKPVIENVAKTYNILPEIIGGIISRETNTKDIKGDFQNGDYRGYGYMQLDIGTFPNIKSQPWSDPTWDITQGVSLLINTKFSAIKKTLPSSLWLQGAIAAYNGNAIAGYLNTGNVDAYTTNNNYSTDVLNRARWLKQQGVFA